MSDIISMTKGELRNEVTDLRLLVASIYRDCYGMVDKYHNAQFGTGEDGIVRQAQATMDLIDEYRKDHRR